MNQLQVQKHEKKNIIILVDKVKTKKQHKINNAIGKIVYEKLLLNYFRSMRFGDDYYAHAHQ